MPLVYDELRKLAAQRLAQEKPGQTLQATALVHEAYLRLVDGDKAQHWNGRGHFFAAAAEAMRRILVENARRKQSLKAGRRTQEFDLDDIDAGDPPPIGKALAVDDALDRLAAETPEAAELVKLRYLCRADRERGGRRARHFTHNCRFAIGLTLVLGFATAFVRRRLGIASRYVSRKSLGLFSPSFRTALVKPTTMWGQP